MYNTNKRQHNSLKCTSSVTKIAANLQHMNGVPYKLQHKFHNTPPHSRFPLYSHSHSHESYGPQSQHKWNTRLQSTEQQTEISGDAPPLAPPLAIGIVVGPLVLICSVCIVLQLLPVLSSSLGILQSGGGSPMGTYGGGGSSSVSWYAGSGSPRIFSEGSH